MVSRIVVGFGSECFSRSRSTIDIVDPDHPLQYARHPTFEVMKLLNKCKDAFTA